MIQYKYLGFGRFRYRGEILNADKLIKRLPINLDNIEMWDDVYTGMCKKYLNFPWQDEDDVDNIKTEVKILILILNTRALGVLFSSIKIEEYPIINLQAEFGDGFKIYVRDSFMPEEVVEIDYRDDSNEILYKGNLTLTNLDTLLNDTTEIK